MWSYDAQTWSLILIVPFVEFNLKVDAFLVTGCSELYFKYQCCFFYCILVGVKKSFLSTGLKNTTWMTGRYYNNAFLSYLFINAYICRPAATLRVLLELDFKKPFLYI